MKEIDFQCPVLPLMLAAMLCSVLVCAVVTSPVRCHLSTPFFRAHAMEVPIQFAQSRPKSKLQSNLNTSIIIIPNQGFK
jgi:hypothetical protein